MIESGPNRIQPELREQARLRRVAEDMLVGGKAPPTRGWVLGTDTLALLYRLASDLNGSDDALAVLHELQVHQVELDLQLEQLEANEAELSEQLKRYHDLYEQAAVGHLLLGPDRRIIELNLAAKRLFASCSKDDGATSPDRLRIEDLRIEDLIAPDDHPVLAAMLNRLCADHPVASCDVEAFDACADAPTLRITAKIEPGSDSVWMIIS